MDAVIYIHGKGGNAAEAEHYNLLFPSCNVIGLEYKSFTPWDAGKEIREAINGLKTDYDRIILIANSIGAFFAMSANIEKDISRAFFISSIVDMEKLITDMMGWAGITESELQRLAVMRSIATNDQLINMKRDSAERKGEKTENFPLREETLSSTG